MSVFEKESLISKVLERQHLNQDIIYIWSKLEKMKKKVNYQILKFNEILKYLDSELPDNFIKLLIDNNSEEFVMKLTEEDRIKIKETFSQISEKIENSKTILFVSDFIDIDE